MKNDLKNDLKSRVSEPARSGSTVVCGRFRYHAGRAGCAAVLALTCLLLESGFAAKTKPDRFKWNKSAKSYQISESTAGKNGVIFVTSGKDRVVVKTFKAGERDPLLCELLQHALLLDKKLKIESDAPVVVYRSDDPKTKANFDEVKKKLLELLKKGSLQKERLEKGVVEIRVTPFIQSYATSLGCDSIAAIHNLPVREIKDGSGKVTVDQDFRKKKLKFDGNALATDTTLKINDQLNYLNAYLKMLAESDAKKDCGMKDLGIICALDAFVGNEDRALKEGFVNWGNVMLGASGSGKSEEMTIVAIDNGGTCIGRERALGANIRIPKTKDGATDLDKWVTAVSGGYFDEAAGFGSVNLSTTFEFRDPKTGKARAITENLKNGLLATLQGFENLHEQKKLLPPVRTSSKTGKEVKTKYGPKEDVWELGPCVKVTPIKMGVKDKDGNTAPRDTGEFTYASSGDPLITIDWREVEAAIAAGIKEGAKYITKNCGGRKLTQPGNFGESAIGKVAGEIIENHASDRNFLATGDELAAEMLALRAYYMYLRVDSGLDHAKALTLLRDAAGRVNLIR